MRKKCKKCGLSFSEMSRYSYAEHKKVKSDKNPKLTNCEYNAIGKERRERALNGALRSVNKVFRQISEK